MLNLPQTSPDVPEITNHLILFHFHMVRTSGASLQWNRRFDSGETTAKYNE